MPGRAVLSVILVAAACGCGGRGATRTEESGLVLRDDGKGVVVEDPRGGVELRFPGRPTVGESQVPFAATGTTRRWVQVRQVQDEIELEFDIYELTLDDFDALDRTRVYDGARDGGLGIVHATLLDEHDTTLLGEPARAVHGRLPDGRETWDWIVLAPKQRAMYAVVAVSGDPEPASHFADRLRATDPAELPPRAEGGVHVERDGDAWRAVDDATHASVRFAARPFLDPIDAPLPSGKHLHAVTASSSASGGDVVFMVTHYDPAIVSADPNDVLDGAVTMAARNAGGSIESRDSITIDGMPGRRLVMNAHVARGDMHMNLRAAYDAGTHTLYLFGGAWFSADAEMPKRVDDAIASFTRRAR